MKKTDVVLICPARYNTLRRNYNQTYLILAGYLEKNGITTEIIDLKGEINDVTHSVISYDNVREKNKEIIKKLHKLDPLVVGIGCVSAEVKDVLNLCRKIKEKFKKVVIVVGGPHPTVHPEDFLNKEKTVDYVIIGEGEIVFTNLVKALQEKKDTSKLKGLAYLKEGKIIENERGCFLTNLDDTSPAYEKIDMEYYTRPNPDLIPSIYMSVATIMTSRGCPARCTFCASYSLRKRTGIETMHSFRQRSVNDVVNEIEFLKNKYKIDAFSLTDDTFLTRKEYVSNFCNELRRRKINLLWGCSSRVNQVNEEILRKMRDAGCIQIAFGVESGNQEMLNTIKKGTTISQIKNAFRLCRKLKIRSFAMFMFNLPNETIKHVNDTINLIKEIKPTNVGFSILTPLPGTEIYEKWGLKLPVDECDKYGEGVDRFVDKRFKFAEHNLDLDKLTDKYTKKFNPFITKISFYFDKKYLKMILKSKRKLDYIRGLSVLLKKFFWRYIS